MAISIPLILKAATSAEVLPLDPSASKPCGSLTEKGKDYIVQLRRLGFEMITQYGTQPQEELYVLLRLPMKKLISVASRANLRMELDPAVLKYTMEKGNAAKGILPVTIPDAPTHITEYGPYDLIFADYAPPSVVPDILYWRPDSFSHSFRDILRLKLNQICLESRLDGENLKIQRYIRKQWILSCFPLHNRAAATELESHWQRFPLCRQPLYEIKEYFGEKVGLYFSFTEHYMTFLCIPAVVGLPLQIAVFVLNDYSAPFLPVFSFCLSVWAVFMLEFWKRREKTIALEWGTIGFQELEVDRAVSFINGSNERYFDSRKQLFFSIHSATIVVVMNMLVVGIVVSIYVIRFTTQPRIGNSNAQFMASGLNALQIQIMNYIYSYLAHALTETSTMFEDSLIKKIFVFQFVNSFASFFFLAFIAERNEKLKSQQGQVIISQPELEHWLEKYDPNMSLLSEYADMVIQFGFTALFVSALPIASSFGLLSNIVSVKSNVWRRFNVLQRPFPMGAEDIGFWQEIFLVMSTIAVITNAGLTVFTMHSLDNYSTVTRFWIFILFQWLCFAIQQFVMAVIPDEPETILIQQQREKFIVKKCQTMMKCANLKWPSPANCFLKAS
eukprot:gene31545-40962_t